MTGDSLETPETAVDRWLDLVGLTNVRDCGGLPLRTGGRTRPGVLLRSANLRTAAPPTVRRLIDELDLRLVLDLRTPREVDRDGPTLVAEAGVRTVTLTFLPLDRQVSSTARPDPASDRRAIPRITGDLDGLYEIYRGYLRDRPDNVVDAVRHLATAAGGAALVHCAAGKDRTGVLVALVLDAVGVTREAVLADYQLTELRIVEVLRGLYPGVDVTADEAAVHRPRREVVERLLGELDGEFGDGTAGGAAGWLRAGGLSEADLTRLRARLTGHPTESP